MSQWVLDIIYIVNYKPVGIYIHKTIAYNPRQQRMNSERILFRADSGELHGHGNNLQFPWDNNISGFSRPSAVLHSLPRFPGGIPTVPAPTGKAGASHENHHRFIPTGTRQTFRENTR